MTDVMPNIRFSKGAAASLVRLMWSTTGHSVAAQPQVAAQAML